MMTPPGSSTPALATTISTPPKRAWHAWNSVSPSAGFDTSARTPMASEPAASIELTVCDAPAASREELTATLAPSCPRRIAIAWPMPRLAPVTSATCPCRSVIAGSPEDPGEHLVELPVRAIVNGRAHRHGIADQVPGLRGLRCDRLDDHLRRVGSVKAALAGALGQGDCRFLQGVIARVPVRGPGGGQLPHCRGLLVPDVSRDRPGLDDDHRDAESADFSAQDIAEGFHRELRGRVGAIGRQRHQPPDGAHVHDTAL